VFHPSSVPDSSPFGQFIGSIIPLASDRFGQTFFDCNESQSGLEAPDGHLDAFRKVGVLVGVNQALQCEPWSNMTDSETLLTVPRHWLDFGGTPDATISDSSSAIRSHSGFRFIDDHPPNM
jgi:hypothetical protein